MDADAQFDGFEHDSLPSVDLDFSVKSRGRANQPEVVVDIKNDGQWIRLPVTKVETRVNKDGPADITRTSRVDLPVTWGRTPDGEEKVPIYDYVGESQKISEENAEFDVARVFYWNQYTSEYNVKQFGYVSSIGPGDQDGTFRFYVYDTSDLMTSISVSKTYDSPTAVGVANFVAYDADYGIESNSPIPITGIATTRPGEPVEVEGAISSFGSGVAGWINENVPIVEEEEGDGLGEATDDWLDDALHTGGHKHFRRNRHTLVDVMNWLTDEIGGAWYFKPKADGVSLVVNNGVDDDFKIARSSYYDGQADVVFSDHEYLQGHNPENVDVINNSSLEDLKPINHLELNGESADSFLGVNTDRTVIGGPLGAPRGHTNKYPHVEVTYPPLLERSGGSELGPRPIESGKQTLSEAKKEAVKKFKEKHEDNTDGSIEVKALPSIRPYDYIAAVPVCNDTFDASMDPIQYEVNSVNHTASADQPYTTSLGVSMALDEDKIEVEATYEEI